VIYSIIFAAGCFWGVQKHFDNLDGVVNTTVVYVDGTYDNPTYDDVLKYRHYSKDGFRNYAEGVKVVYDESKISTKELIESFWQMHNPTQKDGQGNDIGNNYRSGIFYTTKEQKEIALQTKRIYQKLLNKNGYPQIVTQIKPLDKFYDAEEYHQDYLIKNPNGYCPNHSTGVKFEDKYPNQSIVKIKPNKGKEIIVVEADGYCPYCEKFKKDVTNSYKGDLPLRFAKENELSNFKLKTKIKGTPTIFFIQDGIEQIAHIGYMERELFYKVLGEFKLGKDTLPYQIAFNQGTESMYCKKYDIFKNTPDGVFVDKLSGDILFDTKDRFNSKSGWLSFYKSVGDSTIELEDNSYGMKRIEVRARISGAHLGHVFDEGDHRRFCINANVLEFVKRDKIKNK